jgi:hypothetical protein
MIEAINYRVFNTDDKKLVFVGTILEIEKFTGLSKTKVSSYVRNNCTKITGPKPFMCKRLGYNITFRR